MTIKRTPIFYRPEIVASTTSYSPSPAKPRIVVEGWLQGGEIHHSDLRSFPPTPRAELYVAHDPAYVDGVLDGRIENGFGNTDPAVAASLPFTAGSMVAATLHVAEHGGLACSPSSGFHHASYGHGGGFCTFNGLMVAALMASVMGYRVGILDCDAHYGDGTDDILARSSDAGIKHHTFGQRFPVGCKAEGWVTWLHDAVADLRDCDVVLYQAGADPFEHDPLGGQMRFKELWVRDSIVFGALKNVAWNFAGGYTRDADGGISMVQRIHSNTLFESNLERK